MNASLLRPALFLLLVGACSGARALETVRLDLGALHGPGLDAEGARIALHLNRAAPALDLTIERLRLPEPLGEITGVRLECAEVQTGPRTYACADGRVSFSHPLLAADGARASARYEVATERLELDLRGLAFAGGRIDVGGHLHPLDSLIAVTATNLDLARLAGLGEDQLPQGSTLSGRLSAKAELRGAAERLSGDVTGRFHALNFTDADSRYVLQNAELGLSASITRQGGDSRFSIGLGSDAGEAWIQPLPDRGGVLLDAKRQPLELAVHGVWDGTRIRIEELRLLQQQVLDLSGNAVLVPGAEQPLQRLELELEKADLAQLFPLYVKPFIDNPALGGAEMLGQASAAVRVEQGALSAARVELREAALGDTGGRFGVYGINAALDWREQIQAAGVSHLSWSAGELGGIELGSAELELRSGGDDLVLLAPARIPVFDGALRVNVLELRDLGSEALTARFDAALEPIGLPRLTRALGWPEFGGTVAGRLPSLTYENKRLSVGGELTVEAFGGQIRVNELQLEDPLGLVPQLSADIDLRGLDLAALTETFSFGRIEGRLDGDIEGLRLVGWQPAAFDARLYTPQGDDSRHRISQRAINNISSIGGGPTAALSRSFLRFFEDFAYDRIGIGCKLAQDVCQMRGLASARNGGGYYIVRGSGLPRIDVVGYQREVSWSTLMEQIKTATQSEGPDVE